MTNVLNRGSAWKRTPSPGNCPCWKQLDTCRANGNLPQSCPICPKFDPNLTQNFGANWFETIFAPERSRVAPNGLGIVGNQSDDVWGSSFADFCALFKPRATICPNLTQFDPI